MLLQSHRLHPKPLLVHYIVHFFVGGVSLTWGYWRVSCEKVDVQDAATANHGNWWANDGNCVLLRENLLFWGKRSMYPNARFFICYFNEVSRSCKACLFWPISECSEPQAPPHSFLVCRKVPPQEQQLTWLLIRIHFLRSWKRFPGSRHFYSGQKDSKTFAMVFMRLFAKVMEIVQM